MGLIKSHYSIKVPMSVERLSGRIICNADIDNVNKVLELRGLTKGAYMAMLIKRDLKSRQEKGEI